MEGLFEILDRRIDSKLAGSSYLNSLPCRVIEVYDNGLARVELISNGAVYTLPNHSGTELTASENAHVFYSGNVLSEHTAYIGAALHKAEYEIKSLKASVRTGEIFETGREVARFDFLCTHTTCVMLFFNANVFGGEEGIYRINTYVDGELYPYLTKGNVIYGGYLCCHFAVPISLSTGVHKISVTASGVGNFTDISACIFGQHIGEYEPYEPTDENDYIYRTQDGGTEILYYRGDKINPEIPRTLGGFDVKKLSATSFNYSSIESVCIPEGVEEIE